MLPHPPTHSVTPTPPPESTCKPPTYLVKFSCVFSTTNPRSVPIERCFYRYSAHCCRFVMLQTSHSYSRSSLFGKDLRVEHTIGDILSISPEHMSTVVLVLSWKSCQDLTSSAVCVMICMRNSHLWALTSVAIFSWPLTDLLLTDCVLFIAPLSIVLCIKTSSEQLYSEMVEPACGTDN